MKLKTRFLKSRSHTSFTTTRYIGASAVLGMFIIQSATAAITTWTGTGGDLNWTTVGNWNNGLPSGNDVVFDLAGAGMTIGNITNNVTANEIINSLRFKSLTTEAAPAYHTSQIAAGVTLSVTGGGTSVFVNSGNVTAADVVYASITGEGVFSLENDGAVMHVGQGSGTANSNRRATLDMSGLAEFQATQNRLIIGQQSVVGNRANGTIVLAKSNIISLTNTTLPGLLLGEMTSNNGNSQVLELGTTNTILTDTGITVGGRKGNGVMRFNSDLLNLGDGLATFRSRDGTGRQAQWAIGDNSGQSGGSNLAIGSVDFTGGKVDALVNHIILGRGNVLAAATNLTQGTLSFDDGTIDATELTLGLQSGNITGPSRGIANVGGNASLLVSGTVTLGQVVGSYNSFGLININGESATVTFLGDVVCGAGIGNKITLDDGTLSLAGKLGDTTNSEDFPLETLQLNGGVLDFNLNSSLNPAAARANVKNLNVDGLVGLSVSGGNLSPGTVTLIKYESLSGIEGFAGLSLNLPPRVEGNLVHNTDNGTIDFEITGVTLTKWSGAIDGNWDINSTANWQISPGNDPATYLQSGLSGEAVFFDDMASGTKNVNLTTVLSPASITVDATQTYTFEGIGAISGTAGITKRGTGSLIIGNSGTNDFTGGINIEDGKIQIAGSDDRLPVNASVTLADVANSELDLNHFNQTLLSLNGGGSTGGNVHLGSGTLTLTDAGSYAGVIGGSGSLAKSGTGNLVLSGASTFSGGTSITGGRIIVTNATGSGLGSGSVVIGIDGSLALGNGADTGSIAATTIASDGLLIINRSDDTILDKELTGSGGLTKAGGGTLLIDSAKTYGGLTNVNGGALLVTHPQALGSATATAIDGTNVGSAFTARLELSGGISLAEPIQLGQKQSAAEDAPCLVNIEGNNTMTGPLVLLGGGSNWNLWSNSGKLTLAGTATNINTTNTRNLRFYGDGDGEILSNLANGSGTSLTAVRMNGNGTWRLAGTNTYTGPTTVESGTLKIDGSQTASIVTVNPSGTLSGSGTLGTVNASGTIAPDGTLNAATVTLSGTLAIDVSGASADRIDVSGTLQLTGATIAVSGLPTLGSYTLASAATLTGLPELAAPVPGYELVVDGNTLKLNSTSAGTPYDDWATSFNLVGDDALPSADPDNDGLDNLLEFVLGGNPNGIDTPSVQPLLQEGDSNITLSFKRSNASKQQPVAVQVQVSADLTTWSEADEITIGSAAGTGPNGVTYTVTAGVDSDAVVVTIPKNGATKKFARVEAVLP